MSDDNQDAESPPTRREIKVTDKRMFTPDGRLREDFEDLEESSESVGSRSADGAPGPRDTPRAAPPPSAPPPPADSERPPLEIPGTPEGLGAPGFIDLLAVLAEPIPVYLGEVKLPDGQSMEDLRAARFYIDLLDVLGRKTAGNLTPEESTALERTLYELRLRYVQKRG